MDKKLVVGYVVGLLLLVKFEFCTMFFAIFSKGFKMALTIKFLD